MTKRPQRVALAVAGLVLTATGFAPAQAAHAATTEPDEGDRAVACKWGWKDRSSQTATLLPDAPVRTGPYQKCAERGSYFNPRIAYLDCFVRNKYQHTWWHVRLEDGDQGWVWAGNLLDTHHINTEGRQCKLP